jgi:hypothetical protein
VLGISKVDCYSKLTDKIIHNKIITLRILYYTTIQTHWHITYEYLLMCIVLTYEKVFKYFNKISNIHLYLLYEYFKLCILDVVKDGHDLSHYSSSRSITNR